MSLMQQLFELMLEQKASDLHLSEGLPPVLRIHGDLEQMEQFERLDRQTLLGALKGLCSADRWKRFASHGELDFAYAVGDAMRLRANYFLKEAGVGAVFRVIPTKVASLKDLHAPKVLSDLAEIDRGLMLVTGPTGSGKSTTLAAMVDHINENFAKRILTIEDPIEFIHPQKQSTLVQREVGIDTPSFHLALRSAARMDFDVILVGEMRDFETIAAAVNAAELGILVFGTLHTNSAAKAIDRIIDVFPPNQQQQIRGQLAENLRGVCAQTLMRKVGGDGRVAAHEILVTTPAVKTAIREGKTAAIVSAMQSGRQLGMSLMDDQIEQLLQQGVVSQDEAYAKAVDKGRFVAPT